MQPPPTFLSSAATAAAAPANMVPHSPLSPLLLSLSFVLLSTIVVVGFLPPLSLARFFAGVTLRLRVSPSSAGAEDRSGRPDSNPCSMWLSCVGGGDRRKRGRASISSRRETRRNKKDFFDQCLSVLLCHGRGRRRRKRYKYIHFHPSFLPSFAPSAFDSLFAHSFPRSFAHRFRFRGAPI